MPDILRSGEIVVAPLMVWIYDGWTRLLNHEAATEGRQEKNLVFTAEDQSTLYHVFFFFFLMG